MEKNKHSLFDRAKSIFTNKKTVKNARIAYGVLWNLFLMFLVVSVAGGAFAAGTGAGYFASLVKDEPVRSYESMKKDIYNYTETSDVYFAHNVPLGKLRSDLYREEIKLENVSPHLINAVIATEDEYFYEHDGVVPKAILRALVQEVTNAPMQSGGSTLTQQLIKNQILTNEVSFERKAKEILLALRLEKFFEKEEILEAYLNMATFGRNSSGRNIAGVQSAAKGIFGTDAKKLNLAQAAFIAGLPQSPFGYTPFTQDKKIKENLEPGLTRMKVVLKRMYDGGYIDEKQYEEARAYDVTKDFVKPGADPLEKYPWVMVEAEQRATDILAKLIADKDGVTEKELSKDDKLYNKYFTLAGREFRQNGYSIHTTIDKKIYDAMEKAKNKYPYYGPDKPETKIDPETKKKKTVMEPVEVGAIMIENKTGKIISFVGGRDFKKQELNHATRSLRNNGSTMKPLLVYAPAFELGAASPGTILPDVPLHLNPSDPGNPWPRNYGGGYSGMATARYAFAKSYNVPAVKLYSEIQSKNPAKYLEKMGFTSLGKDDYHNRSTALGSMAKGVTVEENTNAFSTFANQGKFVDAYMIEKITDKEGKVIYQHKVKPTNVFSPQTAYLTLDVMRDVFDYGTAASVRNKLKFSTDWAGKTGTGNEYYDSWIVATNPNITMGIWTGYDTQKSLRAKGNLSYSQRTNYLWADLLNAAYDINPKLVDPEARFKMPSGIVTRSFCAISGTLPSEACKRAGLVETDIFNAKYVPTKSDNSLSTGKYVRIGDKNYMALDSTPDDFAETGLVLNPEYASALTGTNFKNASALIPKMKRWSNLLVPDAKLAENGKTPASVKVAAQGNTLKWNAVNESDIIGYRVYKVGGSKVASIRAGTGLSYPAKPGIYYVTAVDIAGKESAPSNEIEIGGTKSEEKSKKAKSPS
ncbi:peptidoglycan glycosyltransferase [Bacillus sp. FJAT-18017]|uniref:transglycosylase domain-containing protein n=1 Tax=Bacillus sp. FJAT-18017 TaxID=1705566 RepID=UPI0006ADEEA8|nr:transglycosylase domain-containing protein [Bacillus sp. FJAT-18017]ALC89650.1 peptidoglycan glycosyltransferase [Bacillus sp. FJAT-18017]